VAIAARRPPRDRAWDLSWRHVGVSSVIARQAEFQFELLAEEQAALSRVALLVARGTPAETLFAVVASQVAAVLDVPLVSIVRYEPDGTALERASVSPQGQMFTVGTRWSLKGTNVVAQVLESGRPARIDDYTGLTGEIAETCRSVGIRSTVGIPIVVAARLWGAMVVSSTDPEPLPTDTEAHLAKFTELVATAIANGEAREELEQLVAEQAALRRVATLVAHAVPAAEVFEAIAGEAGQLLDADATHIWRYGSDESATVVASRSPQGTTVVPLGTRVSVGGNNVATEVFRTGRPARIDSYRDATGDVGTIVKEQGIKSSVGAPIIVDGRLWGAVIASSSEEGALPPQTEARIAAFTELAATAISNTEERAGREILANEQAALRRVATLVAQEAPQAQIFRAIAEEIGRLLGTDEIRLLRYEVEHDAVVVGSWGGRPDAFPVGSHQILEGDTAAARVRLTGRSARIDDYGTPVGPLADTARSIGVRSAVAAPILVEGRLWGAITTGSTAEQPLPPETEARLGQFTELMATAIANAEARAEVERLADEQAALRRVATLVARASSPVEIFGAVTEEAARVVGTEAVGMLRFDPDGAATLVAQSDTPWDPPPLGTRFPIEGESNLAAVLRTGQAARQEYKETDTDSISAAARGLGIRSGVATPIVVEGQRWGVMVAVTSQSEPLPPDTELRLSEFTDLVATAIANAEARTELAASGTRLLTAADDARRRVVRDLHDGAQQRLVHSIINLKLAKQALRGKEGEAAALVDEALAQAEQGNAELRELAHGILPSVLTRRGLRAGVDTVVARLDLPVQVDVTAERFRPEVEASAYFIVAEALTNVVKHAKAECAEVKAFAGDELLYLEVRDDGIGGVDPGGHGLVGLADRATALGGWLSIESPARGGTVVRAVLPLAPG
jgi:GAF domain-containing protein